MVHFLKVKRQSFFVRWFLFSILAAAFFISAPPAHAAQWYNTSWGHRKLLTVNHLQVSSTTTSTLANFTVLVGIASDTDIASAAKATGTDILFTGSDGISLLNYEVERYVSSTGELEAWVKMPTLPSSTDTTFYMYYGNGAATASLQSASNTWNTNYVGVWHMTSGLNDSTVNVLNGTSTGVVATTTSPIIAGSSYFSSSTNAWVNVTPYNSAYNITSTITISAWIKMSKTGLDQKIAGNEGGVSGSGGYKMGVYTGNQVEMEIRDSSNNANLNRTATGGVTLAASTWYYVAGEYSQASGTLATFVNGLADRLSTTTASMGASTGTLKFGTEPFATGTLLWFGNIDEIHISNVLRSAGWLKTEYNNQSSPSTFITRGTDETPPNFTLADFRWFANIASTTPGSPLAVQNATATAQLVASSTLRLRELIRVGGSIVNSSSQAFNLQYVDAGTGSCASPSGGNPASYTNVGTSTGIFQYFGNGGGLDGTALGPTSTDPVDGTSTIVNQTYDESNPFSNSQGAIPAGQDGKWDFSLTDSGAKVGETYCFRPVTASGTVFASYAVYPSVVISNVPPTATNATLNGNNTISLTVGTTTLIQATATVADANGYTDIATTTAVIYRTSLGPSCTLNNNNCYQVSSCALSLCYATYCTATCSANIWYFAEPTDANTPWASDSWSAAIQAIDHENATSSVATSTSVELLSLVGFQATSTINYGSLSPGSTTALTVSTTITSLGNTSLNMTLYGVNLTNGANSVAVGAQHYATSSVSYASGTGASRESRHDNAVEYPQDDIVGEPGECDALLGGESADAATFGELHWLQHFHRRGEFVALAVMKENPSQEPKMLSAPRRMLSAAERRKFWGSVPSLRSSQLSWLIAYCYFF